MTKDSDVFHEPSLGFTIRKPRAWRFVPPRWSPAAMLKNSAESGTMLREEAHEPFVCMTGSHDSDEHVFPTVQVVARAFPLPSSEQAKEILVQMVSALEEQYPDFTLIESSAERIVAGHRANYVSGRYLLAVERDGDETLFEVLSRSYVVFTPGLAFTIGMASSSDPDYYDEDDFIVALSSIVIDRR